MAQKYSLLLASRGAKVVVIDLSGATDAEKRAKTRKKVVYEIKNRDSEAVANAASVITYSEAEAIMEETEAH